MRKCPSAGRAASFAVITRATAVPCVIGSTSSSGALIAGSDSASSTGWPLAIASVTAHSKPQAKLSRPRLTSVAGCGLRQPIEK